jgi:hypothetical protein
MSTTANMMIVQMFEAVMVVVVVGNIYKLVIISWLNRIHFHHLSMTSVF